MNANETKTAETKLSKKNHEIGRLVSSLRSDNFSLMQDCQFIDRCLIEMLTEIGGYGMFPDDEKDNDGNRQGAFKSIAATLENMAQRCEALAKEVRRRNDRIDAIED